MRARVAWLILACFGLAGFTETTVRRPAPPGELVGSFVQPDGGARHGVLILPGGTDRDGNRPGEYNDNLKLLAQGLAGCGLASLRVDIRGTGDSTKALPWELDGYTVDLTEADAAGWLDWLRAHTGAVDLIGQGEGGLTALRVGGAASRIVLLGVAARRPAAVLRDRLSGLGLSAAAHARIGAAIAALEAGRGPDEQPPAIGGLFRLGTSYLISLFKLDPLAELRHLHTATLVVNGTTDLETTPQDGPRLAATRPGVTAIAPAFMNHVLRVAPRDWTDNLATYERADLPLHPQLVPALCRFLGAGPAHGR